MPSPTRTKNRQARIPLTITLRASTFDFIESCAAHAEFGSLDEFFEAALNIYKNHLEALDAFVALEQARGKTMAEIKRKAMPEIVITRRSYRKRI